MRNVTFPLVAVMLLLASPTAVPQSVDMETTITYDVPDHPTNLTLTPDAVNADGKLKLPGDPLITRLKVQDENGMEDVARLRFTYFRIATSGARVLAHVEEIATSALGAPNATHADVEARFTVAPLASGDYVLNVTATSAAGAQTGIERTFRIGNVKPVLGNLTLERERVTPDHDATIAGTLVLADRNFGNAPGDPEPPREFGLVTLRIYKGSSAQPWFKDRATSLTWNLTDATPERAPHPYARENGHGTLTIPFAFEVPTATAPGEYRISVSHAPTPGMAAQTLGSLTLTVEPLPEVTTLSLDRAKARAGAALVVTGNATGSLTRVRLLHADGTPVEDAAGAAIPQDKGTFNGTLSLPWTLQAGVYLVEVVALGSARGGPVTDGKGTTLNARRVEVRVLPPARADVRAPLNAKGVRLLANEGNLPVDKLTLTARGPVPEGATLRVLVNGTLRAQAPLVEGVAVMEAAPLLAPGEVAELVVHLARAPTAMAPGRHEVPVRITAHTTDYER